MPDSHSTAAQPDCQAAPSGQISIIGAGTMGRGIAEAALLHGFPVSLFDRDSDTLAAAESWIHGQPGVTAAESHLSCFPMSELQQLQPSSFVIETIAEIPEWKQDVLSTLESQLSADTVIATNTSSITLKRLAANCLHPERYCGLHFCYPVRERTLVEVVRGRQSATATIDRAEQLVRQLGKTPLIVNDSPGFVINRLLVSYLNEAMALLLEGISIPEIEEAARAFGMPTGPFEQVDLMGVDVAVRVGTHQFFAYADRVVPSALLVKVMKSGRLGAKAGGGFCKWSDDQKRGPVDPWVDNLIRERMESQTEMTPEQIQMRLFLPMLLEARRILDEGLVANESLIDAALSDGLSFRARGIGLMAWAAATDQESLTAYCHQFEHLGARYQPAMRRAA